MWCVRGGVTGSSGRSRIGSSPLPWLASGPINVLFSPSTSATYAGMGTLSFFTRVCLACMLLTSRFRGDPGDRNPLASYSALLPSFRDDSCDDDSNEPSGADDDNDDDDSELGDDLVAPPVLISSGLGSGLGIGLGLGLDLDLGLGTFRILGGMLE